MIRAPLTQVFTLASSARVVKGMVTWAVKPAAPWGAHQPAILDRTADQFLEAKRLLQTPYHGVVVLSEPALLPCEVTAQAGCTSSMRRLWNVISREQVSDYGLGS